MYFLNKYFFLRNPGGRWVIYLGNQDSGEGVVKIVRQEIRVRVPGGGGLTTSPSIREVWIFFLE